jgi:hypothetical protein
VDLENILKNILVSFSILLSSFLGQECYLSFQQFDAHPPPSVLGLGSHWLSSSGKEVENVNVYQTDGKTDGQTTDSG